ncbi:unnamed protein product, partial [Dicrocoelium dendriticum]
LPGWTTYAVQITDGCAKSYLTRMQPSTPLNYALLCFVLKSGNGSDEWKRDG